MNNALIWLLISIGEAGGSGSSTTAVVERFVSGAECQRVLMLIRDERNNRIPRLKCIEARVVKQ